MKLTSAQVEEAFRRYDTAGKNEISAEDFKKIVKENDPTASDDEVNRLLAEVDADKSGSISYEEIKKLLPK
ncbi:CALM1 protein-like protein [Dinothrombium tinctorium]|uniref:CALM1 protein-like protein n=1 Tax=Dinothrombium tinctorium TaxID=1965070 RepID=A0A3S3PL14_9ACAR|nr:CALM1 protein-like protein [Dinothrombium tinctorium]